MFIVYLDTFAVHAKSIAGLRLLYLLQADIFLRALQIQLIYQFFH